MPTIQLAIVPETGTVDLREVTRVAAAIQRQVARDLAPLWKIETATVDAFLSIEEVPLGYWPVIITSRDLGSQAGMHLDQGGQPYALVEGSEGWSITASHESMEMIIDPSGNRTVAGTSLRPDQGRVEYLVEICDPCESPDHAYTVNDVLVSDFYMPSYFDPVTAPGVRYSYSGAITAPRQVLPSGYLSWHDPVADVWWQRRATASGLADTCLGHIERGTQCLRELVNALTPDHAAAQRTLTAATRAHVASRRHAVRASSVARASRLRSQIDSLSTRTRR